MEKFSVGEDGMLRNERLESVRRDREKFVEKQRLNALAGVAARAKHQPNGSQNPAKPQPDNQPSTSQKGATGSAKLNPPSPSPIPPPSSKPSVGDESPEQASGKQAEEVELELEVEVEVEEPKPKKRKQNELLNALLSECGIENPTKTQFSMGNKFLAEIKEVDPEVTPQQIRLFCSQKRSEWRGLDFTPAAVAKHWKAPSCPGNGHSTVEPTPDNPFPGTGPVTLSQIHARFSDNHERYRWMMEMDDQGRFQNG
jgi:hypothetical protein